MKFTIKSILPALLLTAGFTTMQAQRGGGGQGMDPVKRAEQQTTLMTEKLSLSEAQTLKVKEINLKYGQKTKEARDANADGDWSAMRETMTKLRQEQNAELKTVLTAEQFDTWAKYQEEQRSQRESRNGGS